MSSIKGVVVGLVKSLDDPKKLGRIEVHFPWLSENNNSYWARIATLMSGSGRGSWFMPEVDDEVLVAFEHGDSQHPYIIGFLWNGVDKPPNEDIDTKVRRLKTVSGHTLEFDDRQGQERIYIKSQGGHELEIKDTPGSITIKTSGNQTVKLEDTPAGITIGTSAGNEIKISDAPPGITISTQAGTLTVNCLQANINASAMLNISAPITVFSGVVQVPTLIAQAVVGAAYTPAPGNTFGL